MKVTPSILTHPVSDIFFQVGRLSDFYQHFQIDIGDGKFVPNKTASLEEILHVVKQTDKEYLSQFTFDFDLMVQNPYKALDIVEKISDHITIDTVFLHYQTLNFLALPKVKNITMGIALDLFDEVDALFRNYSPKVLKAIQIMTVEAGGQGNEFREEMLNKIKQLRTASYMNKVYLDGGINNTTMPIILSKDYRPDVICPGSYFSKAHNLDVRVEYMNQFADAG